MPSPADRSTTFRVAIRTFGPFEKAIAREWATFCGQSGCGLELEAVSLDHHPLYEELFERGGLARGDWDVAFVNTDWIAEAHERRTLLDLSPYLAADPPEDFPHGWAPSLLRLQQFGTTVLGLPYHDGPECFIYRRDLLEDPARQKAYQGRFGRPLPACGEMTWDDFLQVARFLHKPEESLFGTVFAAFPDGHNTVYDICLQLWTRGGELFDAAGRLQLDTPEMIEALQFYRAMLNDPSAVHPQCREFDSVRSGLAFARGEVAMMINWFGFASMCETIDESKVKGRVGVATIPRGGVARAAWPPVAPADEPPVASAPKPPVTAVRPDSPSDSARAAKPPVAPAAKPPAARAATSASLNVYWMLGVAAGSPHADVAYRFMRHAMGRESDRLRTLDGVIGCRRSTWEDEEVNRAIPFYGRMESLHAHARELPRLVDWVEQSKIIDRMVLRAMDTHDPIETIVREAQAEADLR